MFTRQAAQISSRKVIELYCPHTKADRRFASSLPLAKTMDHQYLRAKMGQPKNDGRQRSSLPASQASERSCQHAMCAFAPSGARPGLLQAHAACQMGPPPRGHPRAAGSSSKAHIIRERCDPRCCTRITSRMPKPRDKQLAWQCETSVTCAVRKNGEVSRRVRSKGIARRFHS